MLSEQIELTNILNEASRAYYIENSPVMSDVEFDMKFKELQRMEKESGEVLPNSPTQRFGLEIQSDCNTLRHIEPM